MLQNYKIKYVELKQMLKAAFFAFFLLFLLCFRPMLAVFSLATNPSLSIAFFLVGAVLFSKDYPIRISKKILFFLLAIYFFLVLQTIYIALLHFDLNNLINGFFVIPIFFSVIYLVAIIFVNINYIFLRKALILSISILTSIGWINIIFPQFSEIFNNHLNHGVFPFTEPSIYALAICPIAVAVGGGLSNKGKFFLVLNLSLQAILFPNLTLFIVIALQCFLFWGTKNLKIFLLLLGFVILMFFFLINNLTYFNDRLNFSSETDNLSALVYLQGWQEAFNSFRDTWGAGLGYRQMGTNAPSEIAEKIYLMMNGEYLNRTDGGFLVARIIGEFGIVGIVFIILFFKSELKLYKKIKNARKKGHSESNVLKMDMLFYMSISIVVDFFVRGGDYLASHILLSLSSLTALIILTKKMGSTY